MPYRPPPPDAERCIATVSADWRDGGAHRCTRRGVIARDGKLYCRQHDPVAIERKILATNAANRARWDARNNAERIRDHRLATWEALLEGAREAALWIANLDLVEGSDTAEAGWLPPALKAAIKAAEKEPS